MADLIAIGKKAIPKLKLMNHYNELIINVAAALMGFSMGRIVILDFLNPFPIALLCSSMISRLNPYIIGLGIIAGSFSIRIPELLLKNMILVLLMIFVYLIINRTRLNNRVFFSIFAPVANLTSGIFIFYFKNYYLYDMLMMIIVLKIKNERPDWSIFQRLLILI